MEYLSKLILDKIQTKNWTPFKFRKKEPQIPHLLFANDILLFNKANAKNIQAIQEVLMNFCDLSGLKINIMKSKVWFSTQVSPDLITLFKNTFDIKISINLGFYLGLPLKHSYEKSDFNHIIDKISAKLQT